MQSMAVASAKRADCFYIHRLSVCSCFLVFTSFEENAEHPGYSADCRILQKAYTLGDVARLVPELGLPPLFALCDCFAVAGIKYHALRAKTSRQKYTTFGQKYHIMGM